MGDEVGNFVRLGQHQYHLQPLLPCQHRQQLLQLVARLGIQSDKGILHDEHLRVAEQRSRQLEFSQLAARQQYQILVEQRLHSEQLVDMPLQRPPFRCVLTSQSVGLLQFLPHGGGLLADLHLVPALLQEVSTVVVTSVSVAEGDVLQVVVWLVEGVAHHPWERRMPPRDHVYQHRLAAAVPAYDGDVLTLVEYKIDGLCHRPFRLLRDGLSQFYRLHSLSFRLLILSWFLFTKSFHPRYFTSLSGLPACIK